MTKIFFEILFEHFCGFTGDGLTPTRLVLVDSDHGALSLKAIRTFMSGRNHGVLVFKRLATYFIVMEGISEVDRRYF